MIKYGRKKRRDEEWETERKKRNRETRQKEKWRKKSATHLANGRRRLHGASDYYTEEDDNALLRMIMTLNGSRETIEILKRNAISFGTLLPPKAAILFFIDNRLIVIVS